MIGEKALEFSYGFWCTAMLKAPQQSAQANLSSVFSIANGLSQAEQDLLVLLQQ